MAARGIERLMQLALPGQPHLTYCTNIHRGETWSEIDTALQRHLPAIKQQISPHERMGVGLRLSALAARELAAPSAFDTFVRFLDTGGFYVFTINAFPYGNFHGERVKERVYEPDWQTSERLRFTVEAAEILAKLLPAGCAGSISTVPGGFRTRVTTPEHVRIIAEGIVRTAVHLDRLRETSGKTIVLAIEPEPACFLETTDEAIRFLEEHVFAAAGSELFASLRGTAPARAEEALRRHVGLCFDVCHSAVEFEDPVGALDRVCAAGISVAKLQLSSALAAEADTPGLERLLERFDDGVYLHQVVERRNGALTRYTDLPDALAAARRGVLGGEWRVHCHVPVFLERFEDLGSTQSSLSEVLALCRRRAVSPHLEVETYTWNVLPAGARNSDLSDDIVRELRWIRSELAA